MSGRDGSGGLPPRLEDVVRRVLEAAGMGFADGDSEVERELRAHFEDGLAGGVPVEELVRRFGDPLEAGRRIAGARPSARAWNRGPRAAWWASPKECWDEARRAVRRLGRAPVFAALVTLTLALGVGANTAIFTVLNAVLFEDLPYADPDRLVRIYESSFDDPARQEFVRGPVLVEWMGWDEVFDSVAALYTYTEVGADLLAGDLPRRVSLTRASAGYFETLGVRPILGRTFLHEESLGPGESVSTTGLVAPVVILAHRLWADQFGADPGLVGRSIELDGAGFEVVGVMPRGFNNPFGTEADLWVPQDLRPGEGNQWGNYYLSSVGRLRAGVTPAAAQERVRTLARELAGEHPEVEGEFPRLAPLHADIVGPTRRVMLWILAGAAGLVLLTACVNVANLVLARGLEQERTLALQSALGSGRGRLVAGIVAENGLLATAGGALGLGLGWVGVRVLVRLAPEALPPVTGVEAGAPVFLFALSATGAALVLFGLAPALRLSRAAPADVLRSGDRAATTGRTARRLRDGLVVVQVAAALVLVSGAALLARSFGALVDVPLGIEPEGVLTFEVHLPEARYADREARDRFHGALQERVAALPGVETVGAVSWLPANGRYHTWGVYWDPANPGGGNDDAWYSSDIRVITGDYFASLGIELVRGASPTDVAQEGEAVAWVNRRMAEQVFGDAEPVGQLIEVGNARRRVVGVVEDIPHSARGDTYRKTYILHAQADTRNWALVQTVRARGELTSLPEAIRGELSALDPQLVLHRPRSFEEFLGTVRAQDRFATILMGAFATLALALSVVGTYGVLAGTVAARTREIGIRMALGANHAGIRALVLRYALALTLPGLLLGVTGAWIGGRWLESLLFGVGTRDPVAFAGAVATLLAVGVLAAWLPAMRATRVDTMRTLTAE